MNELTTADLLRGTIRRRLSRSVVIKDGKAFQRLYDELQRALTHAWQEQMRKAIIDALDRLRDLGEGAFTEADGRVIMAALEARVGPEAIRAAMHDPIITLTGELFRTGAAEVAAATGVDIAFQRPDLDALDALKKGNLIWAGESWNLHTRDKVNAIMREYFTEGMTRQQLARRMADEFRTLTSRGDAYWEMFVDHHATKIREIGRADQYQNTGIEFVQVRARMDEKTSVTCRHMNGRIFPVSRLIAQRDAYAAAANREDKIGMMKAWTMHDAKADLSSVPSDRLGAGVGSPPYHFRCRTVTVAYFGTPDAAGAGAIAGWTRAAYDRKALSRTEVDALIDRARTAEWPHAKVVRGKFRKHQDRLGMANQTDYSQSAIDLIRRGNRDVYTSVRKGALNAIFATAATNAKDGRKGYIITAVDLDANRITSHHWRAKLQSGSDEVPAFKQPGRGIMKWLFG